jgi:cell volume regulation protein A
MSIENVLLIGSVLILVSIAFAKASDNLGVPTLLLFLGIGMLAGSEGSGGFTLTTRDWRNRWGFLHLSLFFSQAVSTRNGTK